MVPSSEQTSSQRTSWQRRFQQPRFRLRRSPSRPALPAGLGRALALALWAVVLLQSSLDGRLNLLLRRVFHPLVAAAGLVLLTLALLQGLVAWRGERGAGTAPPGRPTASNSEVTGKSTPSPIATRKTRSDAPGGRR